MDEDRTSAGNQISETTLAFQFEERTYETARNHPTYYRALNREPRTRHPFHCYDDILRQPALVAETLKGVDGVVEEIAHTIARSNRRRFVFTGIGTSYHLAMSATHMIWRLTGLPAQWVDSSEALAAEAVFDYQEAVFVGLSASGNTVETVEHLHRARKAGALTMAIVNRDNTRLTAVAHERLSVAGGFGLVFDYTTRLAAIAAFALALGQALGYSGAPFEAVESGLAQIPNQMSETLERIDGFAAAVGRDTQQMRAAIIPASGNQLPTAWEMALRFEEMAHFPARGRALVDFLHGAVGFLAPDIMTVLLAPADESYEYALRAARVTRMVKSPVVAVIDEDDQGGLAPVVDDVIRLPVTLESLKPLLYVMPAQLIPYYTEVAANGNPDVQRTDRTNYARAFDIAMPPKSH
jgi:glutamine---fructose-6-phosphate transaminase (isomerizing)